MAGRARPRQTSVPLDQSWPEPRQDSIVEEKDALLVVLPAAENDPGWIKEAAVEHFGFVARNRIDLDQLILHDQQFDRATVV